MSTYKKIILSDLPSDLMMVLIWILATFIFINISILEDSIFRTVLGIVMVLFIPGYVLIAALFPKKDDLNSIERIVLSFTLSMVIVSIFGLLLNFTFGIELITTFLSLFLYTIVLTFIAIYRIEKLSLDERFSIPLSKISGKIYENVIVLNPKNNPKNSPKNNILTGILIFTTIIAIGVMYFAVTAPKMGERFTEFYILNGSGSSDYSRSDNYLTNLKVNNSYSYLIGVVNHEYVPVNYTLKVVFDEHTLTSDFILDHNEIWEDDMIFTPNKVGTEKLEFWLFKDNNFTEPYRELHLWVNSI